MHRARDFVEFRGIEIFEFHASNSNIREGVIACELSSGREGETLLESNIVVITGTGEVSASV